MIGVPKKTIPSIFAAKNLQHRARNLTHVMDQLGAGHYSIEPVAEHQLGDGKVFIGFIRSETNPSQAAEHHGLFTA